MVYEWNFGFLFGIIIIFFNALQLFRKLTRDVRGYVQKVSCHIGSHNCSMSYRLYSLGPVFTYSCASNSVLIMGRMLIFNLQLKQKRLPVALSTHLLLGTGVRQMRLVPELEFHRCWHLVPISICQVWNFFSFLFFWLVWKMHVISWLGRYSCPLVYPTRTIDLLTLKKSYYWFNCNMALF